MSFSGKNPGEETELDPTNMTLSSEDLAVLIVDALLDAAILDERDVERAINIAVEEIDVRKALGDY